MKLQVSLKNLKKIRRNHNKEIDEIVQNLTANYFTDLVKYQEDLLLNVCREYDLSYDELHSKYVKPFKKNLKKSKNSNLIDNSESESDEDDEIRNNVSSQPIVNDTNVLEKRLINDILCYVENKEGGSIYNNEVMKIGEIKQGEFFLYN